MKCELFHNFISEFPHEACQISVLAFIVKLQSLNRMSGAFRKMALWMEARFPLLTFSLEYNVQLNETWVIVEFRRVTQCVYVCVCERSSVTFRFTDTLIRPLSSITFDTHEYFLYQSVIFTFPGHESSRKQFAPKT